MKKVNATLVLRIATKKMLDLCKVHPRETYNQVIKRLVEFAKKENKQ